MSRIDFYGSEPGICLDHVKIIASDCSSLSTTSHDFCKRLEIKELQTNCLHQEMVHERLSTLLARCYAREQGSHPGTSEYTIAAGKVKPSTLKVLVLAAAKIDYYLVINVHECQALCAFLTDAAFLGILSQLSVQFSYKPMKCQMVIRPEQKHGLLLLTSI
ncbi:hypothetical protein KIN20_035285 [Parelaphostrongylus tenuis]|uniref:Uncharacterized protein n=1 Tax=Parelaphostrongylus tenuis TaxID=148309 RepID=A0AAD5RB70_PARTN|nr:hypothetical protein KIN20_035285 [Parelaphostrongylus tenuis]